MTKEQLKAKAFDLMTEFSEKKQRYEAELKKINDELAEIQKKILAP